MASKNVLRWQKLVELAQIDLDKSTETYQFLQQQLFDAEQQLNALKDYSTEYNESSVKRGSWMPAQLATHFAFGEKVRQAIIAQEKKCVEQREVVERAKQDWFAKRAHVKAMTSMLENVVQKELQAERRREQKMMDELASQKFAQKNK